MHAELRAARALDRLVADNARPDQIWSLMREVGADPANIHYTPYLVTAMREAGFWPLIERAAEAR